MTSKSKFTKIEQETIILFSVWEMIDEMVNFEIFEGITKIQNTNLMPKTALHQRMFNVLLCDFLSQPQKNRNNGIRPFDLPDAPKNSRSSDLTFLYYLRRICHDPQLNANANEILNPLERFANWLEDDCIIDDVWFPTINTAINITVPRIKILKICGNIAKHNFARLQVTVKEICDVLKDNGKTINEDEGFRIIPEFFDWFHTHVFAYHASTISEFLNNLRWGIFHYLEPEFNRSYELRDPAPLYGYIYPSDCVQMLPKGMYWDLMNKVLARPFFPQEFTVSQSLKQEF